MYYIILCMVQLAVLLFVLAKWGNFITLWNVVKCGNHSIMSFLLIYPPEYIYIYISLLKFNYRILILVKLRVWILNF